MAREVSETITCQGLALILSRDRDGARGNVVADIAQTEKAQTENELRLISP